MAIVDFNTCICPAPQASRVEGSSTRDDVSKHFGDKRGNPKTSRTRTYPGVIITAVICSVDAVADRRGASQGPTSVHSTLAVCQAYPELLKRREHLILLLPSIPLDSSSSFSPSVGRVCVENALCTIPHANLSHVLTASGYHVMP